jgi:hypothetical protein
MLRKAFEWLLVSETFIIICCCQNAVDLSPCFGSQEDGVWSIDPLKVGALEFGLACSQNCIACYLRPFQQLLALVISSVSTFWSCQNAVDPSPCFGSQVDGVCSIDPSTVVPLQLHIGLSKFK